MTSEAVVADADVVAEEQQAWLEGKPFVARLLAKWFERNEVERFMMARQHEARYAQVSMMIEKARFKGFATRTKKTPVARSG